MVLFFGFSKTAFAAVSGNILTSSRKFIYGKTAVVRAALTFGHTCFKLQGIDLVNREHRRLISLMIVVSGDQRGAESAHDTCDIRTDGMTVRNFFETAQYGVVIEGAALYDDIASKF